MKLPTIDPIIPTESTDKKLLKKSNRIYDFKYDGYRGTLYFDGESASFRSKRKLESLGRFNTLAERVVREINAHASQKDERLQSAIFDGEIVVLNDRGEPQHDEVKTNSASPSYVPFDLLWLNGFDMRHLPLRDRRTMLSLILPEMSRIVVRPLSESDGAEFFAQICANDMEGVVVKRLEDPYAKSTTWYKFLNPDYSQKEGRAELYNKSRSKTR